MQSQGFTADSEEAALQQIVELRNQYKQLQPLAPYANSYMQYAQEFNRFLQERNKQPAAQPQSNDPWHKKYWNPPEYNPQWASMLDRDPTTGAIVPRAGTPPEVALKYQAYQAYRQEQADKLLSNPMEYFEPMVRELAAEQAQQIFQREMEQRQSQALTQQFTSTQAQHLYEIENGQIKMRQFWDPSTGSMRQERVLSPTGEAFKRYAMEETEWQRRHGINDQQRIMDTAWAKVGRDFGYNFYQQYNAQQTPAAPPAKPVNPREAANAKFLAQNNVGAATPRGNAVPQADPPPEPGYVDFKSSFRKNLQAAGVQLDG